MGSSTSSQAPPSPSVSDSLTSPVSSQPDSRSTPPSTPGEPESPGPADAVPSEDKHPVKLPIKLGQSRSFDAENLGVIEARRNEFIVAKRGVILPILPGMNLVQRLIDGNHHAEIYPYKVLQSQPRGVLAKLKPYQLEGLSFLLYLRNNGIGGILGDEMGLGKTMQTLSLFQSVKETEGPQSSPFLVVCPLSVLGNWISEAGKWTPGLSVVKYHGSQEQRAGIKALIARCKKADDNLELCDVLVTTYDTVISEIAWFRRAFVWKYVVLDEGHHIKNPEARRTKLLHQIKTEFKLVLTGTPIQNNLTELWSIFHWLYPTLFDSSSSVLFKDAFCLSAGKVDRVFLEHAKRFLELVMLCRVKDSTEVGVKIPQKTEITLSVPLSESQHSWYMKTLTGCDEMLGKSGAGSQEHSASVVGPGNQPTIRQAKHSPKAVQNMLMELRKCSIHPYLINDAFPDPYIVASSHVIRNSGKFIVLAKMINQLVVTERKKVIIFSGFDQVLNLCEDVLSDIQKEGDFKHARIDGRTGSAWRNLGVHLFNNDHRYMVFLISIKAGGEGLNLVSASNVMFLDEDWNPQVMRQAEARVHRLGQKKPVTVFKIHSRGTVEEQMIGRLAKKSYLGAKVTENMQMISPLDELPDVAALEATDKNASAAIVTSCIAGFMRRERLSGNEVTTDQLLSWSWEKILENCAVGRMDTEPIEGITEEIEQEWLKQKERIMTNVFNGTKVRKTPISPVEDEPIELARADRRIGKKRIMIVDGYEVTKENMKSERSSPSSPSTPNPLKRKDQILHDPTCIICQKPAEMECQTCPRTFHQQCVDKGSLRKTPHRSPFGFMCPSHYCCECQKPASKADNLLYCCKSCTKAFCEECLDWKFTTFIGTDVYAELGYLPKSTFYIECSQCKASQKTGSGLARAGSKRVKS